MNNTRQREIMLETHGGRHQLVFFNCILRIFANPVDSRMFLVDVTFTRHDLPGWRMLSSHDSQRGPQIHDSS